MKKLMIATATVATLLAGVGVASAQNFQDDGIPQHGRMIDRSVGLRSDQPSWNDYSYRGGRTEDGDTNNSGAFRSQEVMPQSPPGGS